MIIVTTFATIVATAGPAAAVCTGGAFAPERQYEIDFGKTLTVPATPNGLLVGALPAGGVLVQTAASPTPSDEESWLGGAQIRYVNAAGQGSRQGGFRYTPNPDPNFAFSGIDSFDYWIIESGCSTDSAEEDFNTVYVTVKPVLANDTYNVVKDSTLTVSANGLLANDKGADPTSVSGPTTTTQNGTLDMSISGDGTFTYTPPAGFSGTDSFQYTVDDLNFDNSYSATVTINVAATATPPGAPASVSAAPGNASATVSWGAATGNGNPLLRYRITQSSSLGTKSYTALPTDTSRTITGLSNGTNYTFSVRAESAAGNGPSASDTATPRTVPGKPTGVRGAASGTNITVSWSAPSTGGAPLKGSKVTASNGRVAYVSGTARSARFTGLKPGSYSFTVKSYNVAGTGPSSSRSPSVVIAQKAAQPTYTARFSDSEWRYLRKTARHFGLSVNEVPKTGVAVIRFILAISPHPPTRAAARPQNTGPRSTTATYSVAANASTMVPVSQYLVLNGNDTLKVGAALMQYFAALQGVR